MIDERTTHLNLPLPAANNPLLTDVERVRTAFADLDAHAQALDGQVSALDAHAQALDAHAQALDGQVSTLDAYAQALDGQVSTLDGQVSALPLTCSVTYDNRGNLRANETDTYALVDGLGLFQYVAGSTEPDDDESCFATTNGRWLLEAVHWDVVDTWQLPDDEARDAADEDFQSNWPGKILHGTAYSSVTSLASVTQTSFTGTITGAAVGDRVIATPPNALGARISAFALVTADNTVTVYLNNPSAASQALSAGTWSITVLKEIV